jgi:SAM-dependent methyltransferase
MEVQALLRQLPGNGHPMLKCRTCGEEALYRFLDLGVTPLSDNFLKESRLREPEVYYPLDVLFCAKCTLVELGYVVPPELMFGEDYVYESSTTRTGREHFHSLAKTATERFGLNSSSLVVDIGSNVGVLLKAFQALGARSLGVDPAPKICEIARKNGIETISSLFDTRTVTDIVRSRGRASIITATNVFAHVDDLEDLVRSVETLLSEKGVFILESPYLVDLLDKLEYDTIYHEHLSYFSLKPLVTLFQRFGMEVFDAQRVPIHGGSLRVFVSRRSKYPTSPTVTSLLDLERKLRMDSLDTYKDFARRVQGHREKLVTMLHDLKRDGKRIVGIGAPAKGNTLLSYCHLGPEILDYIVEKAQLKVGLFTPGTRIPIFAEAKLLDDQPEYGLLLSWNFKDEILENLRDYRKRGGRIIVPIPDPYIV